MVTGQVLQRMQKIAISRRFRGGRGGRRSGGGCGVHVAYAAALAAASPKATDRRRIGEVSNYTRVPGTVAIGPQAVDFIF